MLLLTGVQAAGKSTVAQLIAERLPRSAHVRGDVFRRMVVGGRAEPTPDGSPEALEQLRLRYRLMARTADAYAAAGFTAVAQDVVLGGELPRTAGLFRTDPLLVVVLAPRPEAVAAREAGRAKTAYGREWGVRELDAVLREETPRLGLWLDTSGQSPAETADEVLARAWPEALVERDRRPPPPGTLVA
ncbi:AAA family ATPase [Streptomyces sp. MAR4 CNX-425]|uniref:AAA family ATPase n=1 Tax=Streptomyces sp. MAR4 CNX-425 TaxID=3406343 RepID=UPI003B50AD7F